METGDFTLMYNLGKARPVNDIARHAMTHTSLRDARRQSTDLAK